MPSAITANIVHTYLTATQGILKCQFYEGPYAACRNQVWWIRVEEDQVRVINPAWISDYMPGKM